MRWLFNTPAPVQHAPVVAAIQRAEAKTSGQIRVVLARHKAKHPVTAAEKHFFRLGLDRTSERNGVLIFLAARSRNFAVVGDRGVHEKCGDPFWTELAAAMSDYFKRGDFTDGIVHGVDRAGELLAAHFPRAPGGPDQLPDQIEEVD
jgi:uncharacterized membrane protein